MVSGEDCADLLPEHRQPQGHPPGGLSRVCWFSGCWQAPGGRPSRSNCSASRASVVSSVALDVCLTQEIIQYWSSLNNKISRAQGKEVSLTERRSALLPPPPCQSPEFITNNLGFGNNTTGQIPPDVLNVQTSL